MSFAALTIDVNAKLAGLETGLKRVEDMVGKTSGAISGLSSTVGVLKAGLAGLGAGLSAGLLFKGAIDATDAFKRVDSQLKDATRSTFQFAEAQRRLFDIAQMTRQSYEGVATTFAQISGTAGSSIGTQNEQLRFFETVSKLIALSGSNAASAAAGLQQFRQGLAAGALRGEEFNSVMENIPQLGYAIADGLGVSIKQLREMASRGELTAETIKNAMDSVEKSVDARFKNVAVTFDSTMTKLGNSFQLLVNRIEKETGGPLFELVRLLDLIAEKIGAVAAVDWRDSLADQTAKLQGQIGDAEAGTGRFSGLSQEERDHFLAQARARMDALRERSRGAVRDMDAQFTQNEQVQAERRAEQATEAWRKLANQYASTGEKAAKLAAEIRKAGEAAGKSEAEIQKVIAGAMPKGTGKDALADLIKEAEKADKARMDMLREREAFEAFLGKVLFDDAERQRKAIEAETDANRQRADAWRDLLDPTRKYAQQLEEINRLMKVGPTAGGLSQQEGDLARFLVGNELDGLFAGTDKKIDKTKDAARELGLTFQSAFEDAIIGGKSLQDVLSAIGQDIARIFIRKSISEPFANWFAGLNLFGGLFGGGKAVGGPVSPGTTYLVGERGPELFVPKAAGTIVPNGKAGGVSISQSFVFHGNASRAEGYALAQRVKAETIAAMREAGYRNDLAVTG